MIEINLLPKEYQKKSFNFSLGKTGLYAMIAAAGVIVMLVVVTLYQQYQLRELDSGVERARQRAAMLRRDIEIVDALTDVKSKITDRMAAVERLDRNRSVWVHVLEQLAKDVPEFVWLAQFNKVEEEKSTRADRNAKNKAATDSTATAPAPDPTAATTQRVQLEGHAFTLNALAAFMINVMRSDYFDEVELVSTSEVQFDKYRAYKFVLESDLHFLSDEALRQNIAQTSEETEGSVAEASEQSLN